jgi:hypothetical protein
VIKVFFILILFWTLILLVSGSDTADTDLQASVSQSAKTAETDYVSLTPEEAFVGALIAAREPGGIVRIVDCKQQPSQRQLFPSTLPLQQTLELLKRTNPPYRSEHVQRVINLVPEGPEPELLKVRIKEYQADKVEVPNLAVERLLDLPEVRKKSKELGTSEALKLGGLSSPPRVSTPLTLHLNDVSLREALNLIAREYGNGIWKYTEFFCTGEKKFSVDFIVQ